jgi:peptide/nickel transport system permease protein
LKKNFFYPFVVLFYKRGFYIPNLILISIVSFIIILAPPGDILTTRILELQEAYGSIADEQIAALRHRYGLDQPLFIQCY